MKTITRKQLLAIDNLGILMKAKADGMEIQPEDFLINYAEIDHTLSDIEELWQEVATKKMATAFHKWLRKVEKPEDLDFTKMELGMQPLLMDFVRDVWDYGQETADQEVQAIEKAVFAERGGGKPREGDLTNEDAFEWYTLYTRELAKQGQEAAFIYMQPLILEKLEAGTVRMELADALESDFRRYGQVRTKIIARTESNKAFNWGRRYRFDKSSAIAGYRYSSILDERTTEICNYLHGHSWAIGDPGLDENTPPNHYQCRGLIVPINRFRSFTFNPPEAGWEDGLPDKEKKVYDQFKDSTFYPKAGTVIKKVIPKIEPPKKVAVPKVKQPAKAAGPMRAADIQSVEDVREWGRQRMINVSLDKLPFDVGRDLLARTEKVFDRIPILQMYLSNIKDDPQVGKFNGEYAHAAGTGVSYNPAIWKDVNKAKEMYEMDLLSRFTVENTDYLSVASHEMAHVFEAFIAGQGYSGESRTKPYYASVIRKKVLKETKTSIHEIAFKLSKYGKTSDREFFAEAFCEWIDSPSPRPIAAAVGVEVMRIMAEIEATMAREAIKE